MSIVWKKSALKAHCNNKYTLPENNDSYTKLSVKLLFWTGLMKKQ